MCRLFAALYEESCFGLPRLRKVRPRKDDRFTDSPAELNVSNTCIDRRSHLHYLKEH